MSVKPVNNIHLDPGAQACVELLERTLDDAREGRITTLGIIACGPQDFGSAHAGADAARLNMGIDVLKRTILEKVAPQHRPAIMRR